MRLFLAINLPASLRTAIADATVGAREAFAGAVRWVEPDRLHLTVKFLGEQPDVLPARLYETVGAGVARRAALDVRVLGAGAFPSLRQPRVLWCGVGANPALELLYQDVERAAADVGVATESRAFRPHVTLGRVRAPLPADEAGRLAGMLHAVGVNETFTVETIDLMRSELTAEGARYARLWSASLARAPRAGAGGG